jgi:hypothetical protein
MRKKEKKIVISFETTVEAIAMERYCAKQGIPGRLIPIPRVISAGCGMVFACHPDEKDRILQAVHAIGLTEKAVHECLI